jgi:hypothetical protein
VVAIHNADKQTLEAIQGFRTLRRLDLTGHQTDITSSDLGFLAEFKELQYLVVRLKATRNDNEFFRLLKEWPRLHWLAVSGADVSDACLAHCEGHPSLQVLSIESLSASPKTIEWLARIPNLRMAVIGGHVFSRKEVEEFLRAGSTLRSPASSTRLD